jgi:hypothetical protein
LIIHCSIFLAKFFWCLRQNNKRGRKRKGERGKRGGERERRKGEGKRERSKRVSKG